MGPSYTLLYAVLICLQAETVKALKSDVERLTSELKASETDRASMKDKLDELNHQLAVLRQSHTNTDSGPGKPLLAESEIEVY